MNFSKDESAVSPVIGTILLVAITVVLIAIIAAVVMGMTGNVSKNKDVGLSVSSRYWHLDANDPGTPYIVVMIHGGKDVTNIRQLNVSVEGTTITLCTGTSFRTGSSWAGTTEAAAIPVSELVGVSLYYIPLPLKMNTPQFTTVTGTFADGSTAVLYQGQITLPYSNTSDARQYANPNMIPFQKNLWPESPYLSY